MQVLVPDPRADYRNMLHAFYQIVRHEGVRMTLRGISATVYGSGPAHALYYSSYEKVKALLSRADHSNHIAHGQYYYSPHFNGHFPGAPESASTRMSPVLDFIVDMGDGGGEW